MQDLKQKLFSRSRTTATMGCGFSSPAPPQQPRQPAQRSTSQTTSSTYNTGKPLPPVNVAATDSSDYKKEQVRPPMPAGHRQLKSDTSTMGIPDFDDTFDRDSGYSSPVTISSANRTLTKRFHKPASSIDYTVPDFSNRPFGHTATAWSASGTGPQPQSLGRSPSKVDASKSRSIDVVDASRSAPQPVKVQTPPGPSPQDLGQAAFQKRMQKRNEWTQRGSNQEDANSDNLSGHSSLVGRAS